MTKLVRKIDRADRVGKENDVMRKKTVLLVHNYYQVGGGEHIVFENEKNLLLENGHEVYTYTRSNDELKSSKWKLLVLPFSTIWSFKTYREVRKLIRDKKIEIVHCHNTFPLISPSVYYAARSLNVPVVQTIHNFRFLCPNGLFYREGKICEKCREQVSFAPALKHSCYRNSKIQTAVAVAMLKCHRWMGTYRKINYIFLTEFNRSKFAELIDIHAENIFVKPNFVNNTALQATSQEFGRKFLYVGRLDKYKGIEFLLNVWPSLPEEYQLHIYGDGEYRQACEKAVGQYRNIRYYGFCTQKEIFTDLRGSAGLLFPSLLYESYGMTLVESFGLGRPVVSTDLGNPADIIRASGGGVLYEPGDKESFYKALEEVIRNNAQYASNASRYYREALTAEKNYEKLCEIYDRVQIFS